MVSVDGRDAPWDDPLGARRAGPCRLRGGYPDDCPVDAPIGYTQEHKDHRTRWKSDEADEEEEEVRKREHFEKPSIKRKKKAIAARKRALKKQRKMVD